ncbi:hypothetical protein RA265_29220, partial [Pseudomonas syringae pv. tagetis]|uniref:hypothetical protein n=1 Tax=Pseudomonas syringae group genomosp. 7 TaxID=251699 RepID=UPI00376F4AC5
IRLEFLSMWMSDCGDIRVTTVWFVISAVYDYCWPASWDAPGWCGGEGRGLLGGWLVVCT